MNVNLNQLALTMAMILIFTITNHLFEIWDEEPNVLTNATNIIEITNLQKDHNSKFPLKWRNILYSFLELNAGLNSI